MRYQSEILAMMSRLLHRICIATMRWTYATGDEYARRAHQLRRLERLHYSLIKELQKDLEWTSPRWSEACKRYMAQVARKEVV